MTLVELTLSNTSKQITVTGNIYFQKDNLRLTHCLSGVGQPFHFPFVPLGAWSPTKISTYVGVRLLVSIIITQLPVTTRYGVAECLKGVTFKICVIHSICTCMPLRMCINPKQNQLSPNNSNKRELYRDFVYNQLGNNTEPVFTRKP